jgi:hypothetical protein
MTGEDPEFCSDGLKMGGIARLGNATFQAEQMISQEIDVLVEVQQTPMKRLRDPVLVPIPLPHGSIPQFETSFESPDTTSLPFVSKAETIPHITNIGV